MFVCSQLVHSHPICRETIQDINNIMGALYTATLFLGFGNATTVGPVVAIERTVFYRERGAGMYSALAYAVAQVSNVYKSLSRKT